MYTCHSFFLAQVLALVSARHRLLLGVRVCARMTVYASVCVCVCVCVSLCVSLCQSVDARPRIDVDVCQLVYRCGYDVRAGVLHAQRKVCASV